ncbi:hypothetical protein PR202_gb26440 [Eleusine coracana subsp. coracana]|uniref:Membrane insertase YidC/Oxa/ALB C-terminal domain-containing protein n=1 Tax=Eleusine coracana subsp. coracana TaxID=191504 RepID=A0AAV5FR61_ELECO|nr:hypothetical protein PR202_gb26440 [Eleusine coracana subsp. coracana]
MAKALLSSSLLPSLPRASTAAVGARLPPLPSLHSLGRRRAGACKVRASLHGLESVGGLQAALERAEAALYTLADAAVVAADAAAGGVAGDAGEAAAAVQKNGGWFGFIAEALEVVLKVLKDGLSAVHLPYAYGFAIILLTIIVKGATLPLTKKQVESTLAMQNLQPQIKAIQQRYAGNQDGHPPLGWHDTIAYLVLPVLLVVSQYISMEIMKPPQSDDPSQKNTMLVLKFLPFMIGYFSLSVPSGLSIYWFTNNVLSTAQQVWLRKMGGAKPVLTCTHISARFRQLKEEENRRKLNKALAAGDSASISEDEDVDDESTEEGGPGEDASNTGSDKKLPSYSGKKGKRSKRKRMVQ